MAVPDITIKEGIRRWRTIIRHRGYLARELALELRATTLDIRPGEKEHFRSADSWLHTKLRDSAGDPKKERDRDDDGPLRIVTGLLLRSYFGGKPALQSPWKLDKRERKRATADWGYLQYFAVKTADGAAASMRWGSRSPYARVHEYGIGQVERAYFEPAIKDALPEYRNRVANITHFYVYSKLWGHRQRAKRAPLKR